MNPKESPLIIDGRTYIDAQSLLDWAESRLEPYKAKLIHRDADGNILREEDYITADGMPYSSFAREIRMRMCPLKLEAIEEDEVMG